MGRKASNPRRWKSALLLAVAVVGCSWIVFILSSGVQRGSARTSLELPDPDSGPTEVTEDVDLHASAVARRKVLVDEDAGAVPPQPEPSTPDDPPFRDPTLATLELRILSSDDCWNAAVLGEEPVFQIGAIHTWAARGEFGVQASTDADESGNGRTWFTGGDNNVYRFTNIRPGVPFAVAATDDFQIRVTEIEVAPLLPSESRVVEIAVDSDLGTFRGRVLAPNGAPVPRATVSVAELGAESLIGIETNEEGRFALANVGAVELALFVEAQGYAPLAEPHFRIPQRAARDHPRARENRARRGERPGLRSRGGSHRHRQAGGHTNWILRLRPHGPRRHVPPGARPLDGPPVGGDLQRAHVPQRLAGERARAPDRAAGLAAGARACNRSEPDRSRRRGPSSPDSR